MQNVHLYSSVPKEQLEEMLEAFYACTKIPIHLINEEGDVLIRKGEDASFCQCFRRVLPKDDSCRAQHLDASKMAVEYGEAYIFPCHANLNHITYPIVVRGVMLGAVLVGPFLMQEADSVLVSSLTKNYEIATDTLLDLYDRINEIVLVPPETVTHISRLLSYMFAGAITDSRIRFLASREKTAQQARISESIQMYKTSGSPDTPPHPFEKEKELLRKVKSGNVNEARAVLNDLLGYILFSSGSDLSLVKNRAMEISSMLSRAAIEEGSTSANQILQINNQFLTNLAEIRSIDALCSKLLEIVETFTNSMFADEPIRNTPVIEKAFSYISRNYMQPLTLEMAAAHVHLSPAYFSTVFKQSCGTSFSEYLNLIRIEESKRLLGSTDYPILDIAIAVGYRDQSYFSKVFKKYTGMTPGQYRQPADASLEQWTL